MLLILSLVVIAVVALMQYRNGLFSALAMCLQIVLAGLVTFNFWEPAANHLDIYLQNSKAAGYEDWVALTGIFVLTLVGLRTVTNKLCPEMIDYHMYMQQAGAVLFGLLAGYLVSGFLICVLQTLPLEEEFLGFEPRSAEEAPLRSLLPADRVWLSLMRHAGAYALNWKEDNAEAEAAVDRFQTFDRDGTFEMRYLRHRRHTERRPPLPYQGEFERELYRKK